MSKKSLLEKYKLLRKNITNVKEFVITKGSNAYSFFKYEYPNGFDKDDEGNIIIPNYEGNEKRTR